jgi:hypothetical protein
MTDKPDRAKFLAEEAEAVELAERDGVRGSLIGCTVTRHGRTFRVEWSEQDQEHVGLATDFPSLSWLAATEDDALIGIMRLVRDIDEGRA